MAADRRSGSPNAQGRSQLLAGRAYRSIKDEILSGGFRPGEMVLGGKLAEMYRMSRTPIHEALKTLAKEGLVQVMPRVGYVISPVTVEDVYEIFQLRLVIESAAVELAARRATPHDVDNLRRIAAGAPSARGIERTKTDARLRGSSAHRDFHLTLASLSGNRRLVEALGRLLDDSQRILLLDPRRDQQENLMTPASHGKIVKAVAAGDPRAAVAAVLAHIREAQQLITQSLIPELAPRPSGFLEVRSRTRRSRSSKRGAR